MMMMAILNAAVQVMKCKRLFFLALSLEQSILTRGRVQAHGSKELSTL